MPSGLLTHSPADILSILLINHGLGILPSGQSNIDWSVFTDNEPNTPDKVITVYNTTGRINARLQIGMVAEMHGIQVRVRSDLSTTGYTKAREIAIELDEQVYQEYVTVDSTLYCVHSFSRIGDVIPLGTDSRTPTKRNIYTVNGLLIVTQK